VNETCEIHDGDSGEPCGKAAHFVVYPREEISGELLGHCPIWLCAEHYDWWQRTERVTEGGE
jgi:uncharacterized protein (DUF779 family)